MSRDFEKPPSSNSPEQQRIVAEVVSTLTKEGYKKKDIEQLLSKAINPLVKGLSLSDDEGVDQFQTHLNRIMGNFRSANAEPITAGGKVLEKNKEHKEVGRTLGLKIPDDISMQLGYGEAEMSLSQKQALLSVPRIKSRLHLLKKHIDMLQENGSNTVLLEKIESDETEIEKLYALILAEVSQRGMKKNVGKTASESEVVFKDEPLEKLQEQTPIEENEVLKDLERQNMQVRGGNTITIGDGATIGALVGGDANGVKFDISDIGNGGKKAPEGVSTESSSISPSPKEAPSQAAESISAPVTPGPASVEVELKETSSSDVETEKDKEDLGLSKKKKEISNSVAEKYQLLLEGIDVPVSGFDIEQGNYIKSIISVPVNGVLEILNNDETDEAAVDAAVAQWENFLMEKAQILSDHFDLMKTARDAGNPVVRNKALYEAFAFPDELPGIFMTGNKADTLKTKSEFTLEDVDGKEVMKMKEGSELTEYEEALLNWKKSKGHLAKMTDGFEDPDTGLFVPGYMSGANQAQMKSVAQELENSGKFGRLFSRDKRERYKVLENEKTGLETREEAYRESKELYFKSLHNVLNERKARGGEGSTEKGFDDYNSKATIGAHFFAKQGDVVKVRGEDGVLVDKDLTLSNGRLSFHDKEHAFNESILPERKKNTLDKVKAGWNKMSPGKKALVAGGIAAGAVALNGLNPTRMLTAVLAGTLTRKGLNLISSDEKVKAKYAKQVEGQRGKYDTARVGAASSISPESFKALEASLSKEYSAIDTLERKNETKMALRSAGKTAIAAGVGAFAGSQIEGDVVGDAVKGWWNGGSTTPGMDTGTPLTPDGDLSPPTPSPEAVIDHSGEPGFRPSSDVVSESLVPAAEVVIDHSGEPGFRPSNDVLGEVPAATPEVTAEPTPTEPAMVMRTFTETIRAPEQYIVIPEQFGGTDTLSETLYENFKAGNIENLSNPDMSRTEFLNQMNASIEALRRNDRILELMSVDGHPPLERLDLVYKDAAYDIQPLIDHMNGMSLDQIESGTRESVVTRSVPVGGYVIPPEGAGSILEGVPAFSASESVIPSEGAGSVLEGIDTPSVVATAEPVPAGASAIPSEGAGSVLEGIDSPGAAASIEPVTATPAAESVIPSEGAGSTLEGVEVSESVAPAETVSTAPEGEDVVSPEGAGSVLEGVDTPAEGAGAVESTDGAAATSTPEATSTLSEVAAASTQARLEALGFNENQIEVINLEMISRSTEGMSQTEWVARLESIIQRDLLSARLDSIAGVSPENGMRLLFEMNPSELVNALNQGTLESVLEAQGIQNPNFYTSMIIELQRTGLLGNGPSFAEVLENALDSRQIEVVTTLLGEEKLRVGTGGVFGNARTINLSN